MMSVLELSACGRCNARVAYLILLGILALHVDAYAVQVIETNTREGADEPMIGIDLGGTSNCVGVFKDGFVHILENDRGNRVTPSYVSRAEDGSWLVGEDARARAAANPNTTFYGMKWLLGRELGEPFVEEHIKHWPFEVVSGPDGKPAVRFHTQTEGQVMTAEQISAVMLKRVRAMAEARLGLPVHSAVITVPAYFTSAQRQATTDAARLAGLHTVRLINEPIAAAMAYGLDGAHRDRNIVVYHLGGRTADVTVISLDDGVFEVLSTASDAHLGGHDFDERVLRHFTKVLRRKTDKTISNDRRAMEKLRREVEKAKRILSSAQQARVEVEHLVDGLEFSEILTRTKFEALNEDLFRRSLRLITLALKDAQLNKSEIDEVVLEGGSTRIPKVQQLVRGFFDGKEPNRGINAEEAVAYGAAVKGGVISGAHNDVQACIQELVTLTLGVETNGGVITPVIHRNTLIPTRKSRALSFHTKNQSSLLLRVYEGERPLAQHNDLLGQLELTGLAPTGGRVHLEVMLEVDVNGDLTVSATENRTGTTGQVVIPRYLDRLTVEEVEERYIAAEEHAAADQLLMARVTARNDLEDYAYRVLHSTNDQDPRPGVKGARQAATRVLVWLDQRQDAPAEDTYQKRGELVKACNSVLENINDPGPGAGQGNIGATEHGDL